MHLCKKKKTLNENELVSDHWFQNGPKLHIASPNVTSKVVQCEVRCKITTVLASSTLLAFYTCCCHSCWKCLIFHSERNRIDNSIEKITRAKIEFGNGLSMSQVTTQNIVLTSLNTNLYNLCSRCQVNYHSTRSNLSSCSWNSKGA